MYLATIHLWNNLFSTSKLIYWDAKKLLICKKIHRSTKKVSFPALLLQNWYLTKKILSENIIENIIMNAIVSDHQTLLCYDEVFHCCSEHWMCFLRPRQQNLWNTGIVNSLLHHFRMIKTNLWLNGYHLLNG